MSSNQQMTENIASNTRTSETPDFAKGDGVITVVAQDAITGAVLMVAQMDREAYDRTRETGEMHYRSRTRGLWHKGATSGNVQYVESLVLDCDADTLLARVRTAGPACHTGEETCFGPETSVSGALGQLAGVIEQRAREIPQVAGAELSTSYTQKLLSNRNLRLKKLGEETAELVVALADHDQERIAEEAADLLYHMLVALRAENVPLRDVLRVLANRRSSPNE